MTTLTPVKVSELFIGATFKDNKKVVTIKEIDASCSKRDHVHINNDSCWWLDATVMVVQHHTDD